MRRRTSPPGSVVSTGSRRMSTTTGPGRAAPRRVIQNTRSQLAFSSLGVISQSSIRPAAQRCLLSSKGGQTKLMKSLSDTGFLPRLMRRNGRGVGRNRCGHVDAGAAVWVWPGGIGHALPAHVGAQFFAGDAAGGGAFDVGAAVGRHFAPRSPHGGPALRHTDG